MSIRFSAVWVAMIIMFFVCMASAQSEVFFDDYNNGSIDLSGTPGTYAYSGDGSVVEADGVAKITPGPDGNIDRLFYFRTGPYTVGDVLSIDYLRVGNTGSSFEGGGFAIGSNPAGQTNAAAWISIEFNENGNLTPRDQIRTRLFIGQSSDASANGAVGTNLTLTQDLILDNDASSWLRFEFELTQDGSGNDGAIVRVFDGKDSLDLLASATWDVSEAAGLDMNWGNLSNGSNVVTSAWSDDPEVHIDNFRINSPIPEPGSLLMLSMAALLVSRKRYNTPA